MADTTTKTIALPIHRAICEASWDECREDNGPCIKAARSVSAQFHLRLTHGMRTHPDEAVIEMQPQWIVAYQDGRKRPEWMGDGDIEHLARLVGRWGALPTLP